MAANICIEAVSALSNLEVDNLSLARGERLLIRGLGFRVAAGQALSLEGPNGVGKTTLLRALAGFIEPCSGTILLHTKDGAAVAGSEERSGLVGWLGHQDGAKPQLTAVEALGFFTRFYRAGGTSSPRSPPWVLRAPATCRCNICRPGRNGAWRWPGFF